MIHANPQLDIPLTCPRSLLNGDRFYQTVYRRSASQRGRPIDGLVTRLEGSLLSPITPQSYHHLGPLSGLHTDGACQRTHRLGNSRMQTSAVKDGRQHTQKGDDGRGSGSPNMEPFAWSEPHPPVPPYPPLAIPYRDTYLACRTPQVR